MKKLLCILMILLLPVTGTLAQSNDQVPFYVFCTMLAETIES